MVEPGFAGLRETLVRAGIAARHAQRAALEVQSHYQQLLELSLARGAVQSEAHLEARALLGSDEDLVQGFVAQRELRSWSSCRPCLYFLFLPVLCFIAFAIAVLAAAVAGRHYLDGYLHLAQVSSSLSSRCALGVRIAVLWVAPIAISAAFGAYAHRRRIAPRWPALGVVVLCFFASLLNVDVVIGAAGSGYIGAGIGVSTHSILAQCAQAAVRAALVLVAAVFMWSRRCAPGRRR